MQALARNHRHAGLHCKAFAACLGGRKKSKWPGPPGHSDENRGVVQRWRRQSATASSMTEGASIVPATGEIKTAGIRRSVSECWVLNFLTWKAQNHFPGTGGGVA
jgi:hypothetical protein